MSYVSFLESYNRIAGETFGGQKAVTPQQKKKIKLLMEYLDENEVTVDEYFTRAVKSKFLKYGKGEKPWKADFNFLIRVDKGDMLIHGRYDFLNEKKSEPKRKILPEREKNAIIKTYEGLLSEERERAEAFRQSTIRTKGYDPKLDKEVR